MSDIFSLNGCYLITKPSGKKNDCTSSQLASAKTLLTNDTSSDVNAVAANLITGASGSETIGSENNAKIIKAALSDMETNALTEINSKRSVQINTYYAKKHDAQNYVLKVIYTTVLVVAIMWAIQTYTDILPDWVFTAGMSVTIGVCSIIIIFKSIDITNRSKYDYDQKITTMKELPPLGTQDSPYSPLDQASAQSNEFNQFGKNCQNGECCPKFFSFNPSLGYCSFQPFTFS
jgi:hypothetical protein